VTPKRWCKMLLKQITDFEHGEKFKYFKYGVDYYTGNNTEIMKRKKCVYDESAAKLLEVPYKANHKYPSGFFKIIVDQKVQYLLGNGVKGEELAIQALDEATNGLYQFLIKCGTTASQKGRQWVYMYVEGGKLKYTRVAPEQVMPTYKHGKLESVTYFYEEGELKVAEVWTADDVKKYTKRQSDGDYAFDSQMAHYKSINKFNGEPVSVVDNFFGIIPFIPLNNNEYQLSDLKNIKALIDIYDIIASDFANNIDDMQDAFFIIKNFGGTDVGEFLNDLKRYKSIKVGDDGDVKPEQLEIPTEARKVFLEQLRRDIYNFAMGVDTTNTPGGSITNVMIRSMYANLDLKCDQFEMEVTDFLNLLLAGINNFYGTSLATDYTFERSLIINKTELLQVLPLQTDMSIRSRLEANPLVQDTDKELERLEEERKTNEINLGGGLGFEE